MISSKLPIMTAFISASTDAKEYDTLTHCPSQGAPGCTRLGVPEYTGVHQGTARRKFMKSSSPRLIYSSPRSKSKSKFAPRGILRLRILSGLSSKASQVNFSESTNAPSDIFSCDFHPDRYRYVSLNEVHPRQYCSHWWIFRPSRSNETWFNREGARDKIVSVLNCH